EGRDGSHPQGESLSSSWQCAAIKAGRSQSQQRWPERQGICIKSTRTAVIERLTVSVCKRPIRARSTDRKGIDRGVPIDDTVWHVSGGGTLHRNPSFRSRRERSSREDRGQIPSRQRGARIYSRCSSRSSDFVPTHRAAPGIQVE